MKRSEYVAEHYEAARAASPLLDGDAVLRKLWAQHDTMHRLNGTPCTPECDPGNCEAAHREHFGWDAVEAS